MKALLLTNLFPSVREPTRGIFNRNRFQALAEHCDLRVLSPVPWWLRVKQRDEWLQTPSDTVAGIPTRYPSYWSVPGRPVMHGRGMYLSLVPHLDRLRREYPFEVIVAAWAYPDGVAAAHLARRAGVPLVTMVLGSDVNELARQPALRSQIHWGLSQATRVVALSHALRDRVLELGLPESRVLVQHNGVDGDRFCIQDRRQARRKVGLAEEGTWICYVGNFVAEKGVSILIEALRLLRAQGRTDLRLAMVGSGSLEGELRAAVRSGNLEPQVQFCGRRPHAEIPDWIAAGDLLCLPSFREGCPNVVLEALASGRPVVASAVGGVPELIEEQTGCLVPAGDAEALAQGITRAVDCRWNPDLLRGSVACLSWRDFGQTLHRTLEVSVREARG